MLKYTSNAETFLNGANLVPVLLIVIKICNYTEDEIEELIRMVKEGNE